jgi:hypothetical protein
VFQQIGGAGEVYDAGPRPGTACGRIACVAHGMRSTTGRKSNHPGVTTPGMISIV